MKCLLGAVKSPLDKLTPSCRTLSDPFPALDRMLCSSVPWRTPKWPEHTDIKYSWAVPQQQPVLHPRHTHISGWKPQTALHQNVFKNIFYSYVSGVVMFQTVLSMHRVQHWKMLWEFQYHTSFPSATTLSTELCCTVNVENKKGRKGKLATDQ